MLIGSSLMVLIMVTLLSFVIGSDFIGGLVDVGIDNEALIDGASSTFEVIGQDVLFSIDTSDLITAGIALLITVSIVAGISGITFLGSGLNPQSAKIVILIVAYTGIWFSISVLAFNLIAEIEVFGSVIYISLTLAYVVGVVQKLSGGG